MAVSARRRRGVTVSQSRAQQNLATTGRAYKNLSRAQQSDWLLLGQQMVSSGKTARTLSANQAFSQVNGVRLSSGMKLLPDAPAAPDWPNGLPPVQMAAQSTGGLLALTLQQTGYTGPVQVWGAPPCLAGTRTFHPASFKLLGIAHLTSGVMLSVSSLYLSRFAGVVPGDKLALTL